MYSKLFGDYTRFSKVYNAMERINNGESFNDVAESIGWSREKLIGEIEQMKDTQSGSMLYERIKDKI